MSADRKAAVWIGVLFIVGTVALVLSFVVTGDVLAGPDYLARVAAEPSRLALGAMLVLLAGFALAMAKLTLSGHIDEVVDTIESNLRNI